MLIPVMIPCLYPQFLFYVPSPNFLHTVIRNAKIVIGFHKFHALQKFLQHTQTKTALQKFSDKQLENYILPKKWLNQLDRKRVGIFPWEVMYAPANRLNYIPFPVLQTYVASTPYLDQINSGFLENSEQAPDFLLMEWLSMHNIHTFSNVPAMWLTLYKWYDAEKLGDSLSPSIHYKKIQGNTQNDLSPLMLLRRRQSPRFKTIEQLECEEYQIGEFINVPDSSQPVIMKAALKLNIMGKLSKIFWKIPEVHLELLADSGYHKFRFIPEMLQEGLMLNPFPLNLNDIAFVTQKNQMRGNIYHWKISGPGASLYERIIKIEYLTLPEIKIDQFKLPEITSLEVAVSCTSYKIESINVHDLAIDHSNKQQFVTIRGWALDDAEQDLAGGVYIDIDGTLYPAYYGTRRDDVANFFQQARYRYSGFQFGIPAEKLGKGRHTLSIKVLTKREKAYYVTPQKINFDL